VSIPHGTPAFGVRADLEHDRAFGRRIGEVDRADLAKPVR
jgi:hypothetical protein